MRNILAKVSDLIDDLHLAARRLDLLDGLSTELAGLDREGTGELAVGEDLEAVGGNLAQETLLDEGFQADLGDGLVEILQVADVDDGVVRGELDVAESALGKPAEDGGV